MQRALLFVAVCLSLSLAAAAASLPKPPANAKVFSNIDDRGNWSYCHNPGCAGGSGKGTYWMAEHQSSPSRDGASTEFYNSGVWANALWWQKLGANDGVHHFLWDFYFQVNDNAKNAAQALEFDTFQFVHGYNYMIGTECNIKGGGVWDTWNGTSGKWAHTSIPCSGFSPNTWHHIQWYMTTNASAHTYTYVTLVVDGKAYGVNVTQHAKDLGWSDNMGVQFQMDVDASGEGFHEWTDAVKLTVW